MENLQYAGLDRRLLAAIIDYVILGVVSHVLFVKLAIIPNDPWLSPILQGLLIFAYFSAFHASNWQSTFGKKLLKIYVGKAKDGVGLTAMQSMMREVVLFAPLLLFSAYHHLFLVNVSDDLRTGFSSIGEVTQLLYFIVIILMIAFTSQKMGLHDIICKTRVLRRVPDPVKVISSKYVFTGNIVFAGFWRRAWANILDALIMAIPILIIEGALLYFYGMNFFIKAAAYLNAQPPIMRYLVSFIWCLIPLIYCVVLLSSRWQATLGKRILQVYIVRAKDGGRLGYGRNLARYAILYAPFVIIMMMNLFYIPMASYPMQSTEDQQRFLVIQEKMMQRQELTQEEKQIMDNMMNSSMRVMWSQAGISDDDITRLFAIQDKQKMQQPLTEEEASFVQEKNQIMSSFTLKRVLWVWIPIWSYALLIFFMIGLTRQKAGLHDLICKTRALRGTPEKPLLANVGV